jgi:hypothetical protein
MKIRFIYLFCVIAVLFAACAKIPTAEMDSAREAVFRAENDEDAVLYAANTLARARDALRRMDVEADSKRYDAVKTLAAEAIAAADRAVAEGRSAASRAQAESNALLSGLRPALDETQRNINGARYSLLDLDYDQLEREFWSASNLVEQAESNNASGNHHNALEMGRRARATITDINQRIANAIPVRKQ